MGVVIAALAVLIAILDTGIMAEHSHFANTVIIGDVADLCGHGTAMAGIVVDTAPLADILSVDVQGIVNCTSGVGLIKQGIYGAVDAGADILVIAWNVKPANFVEEIAYAKAHEVVVIFSNGLLHTQLLVPLLDGGYGWISGTSMTAAHQAGLLARFDVYMPVLKKE